MSTPLFADACTIRVVRFELYPADDPDSYAVGFNVVCTANHRSVYRDTTVTIVAADAMTNEEIVAHAWTQVKDSVEAWYTSVASKSSLIGTTFVPPL